MAEEKPSELAGVLYAQIRGNLWKSPEHARAWIEEQLVAYRQQIEREAREEGIREGKVTLAGNHVKDLADIYGRVGVLGHDALLALKRALEGAFEAGEKRERERWRCGGCGNGYDDGDHATCEPTTWSMWIRKED